MNDSNDKILKSDFIRQCEDLTADIIDLSIDLNDGKIDINNDINRIIEVIEEMKDYKKNLSLSEETKVELNKRFDKVKEDFVSLKNKHIVIYNEKVDYINERVTVLTTKLDTDGLSQNIRKIISKLEKVNNCKIYIDGKWDQNQYLNMFDYSKLERMYNYVGEIERILKINVDEPLNLFTISNGINNSIRQIRRDLNEELSLTSINSNLDKCITLLERVADLDIKLEFMREKLSKEMFEKYNEKKVLKFRNDIKKLEEILLEKKSNLVKKSNYYAEIFNKLDHINSKYDMLNNKILEYKGKCTSELITVFDKNLKYLTRNLLVIQKKIKQCEEEGLLNQEQKNNIYNKLRVIADKHKKIERKFNEEPILLKEEEKERFVEDKIKLFNVRLNDLEEKIIKLDVPVKNKKVRSEIISLLSVREKELEGFENLLSYCKVHDVDRYEELNKMIEENRNRFEKINDSFYNRCPLRVKSVKSIQKLYKKHHKLGLISAGLSVLALFKSSSALIPAIIHGNIMVAKSVPTLKGMMAFFNKILGNVIGATLTTSGVWKLANGTLLTASVATTSLLKFLATFSVGTIVFFSPGYVPQIISMIKKLMEKIRSFELKEKLIKSYEKGRDIVVEKIENKNVEINNKVEQRKTKQHYMKLYSQYCDDLEISLDMFCEINGLSENEKNILKLMEEEDRIKTLKQQELYKISSRNVIRSR